MLLENSGGCQIAKELFSASDVSLNCSLLLSGGIQRLSSHEVIIYKPRRSAFFKILLDNHLKELGISTLIFTGCNFPNCPRASIYEARKKGNEKYRRRGY